MERASGPDTAMSCGPIPRSGAEAFQAGILPKLGRRPCTPQA